MKFRHKFKFKLEAIINRNRLVIPGANQEFILTKDYTSKTIVIGARITTRCGRVYSIGGIEGNRESIDNPGQIYKHYVTINRL